MSRVAYVNGRYLPHGTAAVHVEDRGYQFADGVYEVIVVRDGRLIDEGPHLDRLERSLAELRIRPAMARAPLRRVIRELVRRNRIRDGMVYIQMTRGVARRDHAFPDDGGRTSLVMTARGVRRLSDVPGGVSVVTVPDIRWGRCDIKSVSLLPNVLAKQAAREAGAYEAWQVGRDGCVTEGAATNAWIVTRDGVIMSHGVDSSILPGITRHAVMRLAQERQMRVVERAFTVDEAQQAAEAFLTSTTNQVRPVLTIDGVTVGDGSPGPVTRRLQQLYVEYMDQS